MSGMSEKLMENLDAAEQLNALAKENATLREALSSLGVTTIEAPKELSFMDLVLEEEQKTLDLITKATSDCEAKTGRSLYKKASMCLSVEADRKTGFQADLRPGAVNYTHEAEPVTLKSQLSGLGLRAGQGTYNWDNADAFLAWAKPLLRNAFTKGRSERSFR